MLKKSSFLVALSLLALVGCIELDDDEGEGASGSTPSQAYTEVFSPLPSEPIYPSDNQWSQAKEYLGEMLFFDPILSSNNRVACSTCHHPDKAWGDAIPRSIGFDGVGLGERRFGEEVTDKNSPTIMNVAFTGLKQGHTPEDFVSGGYFWDKRADTLEAQALMPILNKVEMRGQEDTMTDSEYLAAIAAKVADIHEYQRLFDDAFPESDGNSTVTPENIAKALATFQRKIITPNSRFDQFLEGDTTALTQQEIIGLNKFINGGCSRCHSGPMLSDNTIHTENGIVLTQFAEPVRTPSLRNISKTAPYMQDGSHATLRAAIAAYEERGDLLVILEDEDFGDIEAFLRTLDSDDYYQASPVSVPSGEPVGGDIYN